MTLSEHPTGTLPEGPSSNGSSNGSSDGGPGPTPLRPAKPGGISMRPAMVVLGVAVAILTIFVVIGVTSSPPPSPVHRTATATAVPGSPLHGRSAAALLAPVARGGEPPANVLDAVLVPTGATALAHQDNNAGAGQFDAQVTVRTEASQADAIAFFDAAMKLEGWQVFSRGPATHHPGTIEVLGKLAGTDGYYWEMGALVPPTTFPAGGSGHGQTDVTIRLFQIPDPQ